MRKHGIVQELGSNLRLIVVKEGSSLKAGGQASIQSPSRLVIIFCWHLLSRYYSLSMPPTGSSDGSYQRRWWACRRFVPAADQATNCFMCPSACYLENYVISIVSLGYGRVIASILPAKIVNHSLFFSWALLENLTDWWCPIRVLFAQINEVNSIQLLIVPVDSLLAILATNYSILVTRA